MYRLMWWLLTHKPLKGWIKPRQATSRWNFTSVLFALALFFAAFAPSLLTFHGGEQMTAWLIGAYISLGLGVALFLFLIWFLLWCHKNPSDDSTKPLVDAINTLIEEIRNDRKERNGKRQDKM